MQPVPAIKTVFAASDGKEKGRRKTGPSPTPPTQTVRQFYRFVTVGGGTLVEPAMLRSESAAPARGRVCCLPYCPPVMTAHTYRPQGRSSSAEKPHSGVDFQRREIDRRAGRETARRDSRQAAVLTGNFAACRPSPRWEGERCKYAACGKIRIGLHTEPSNIASFPARVANDGRGRRSP